MGGGVCGDEVPKTGGVGWCWDVDVVLRCVRFGYEGLCVFLGGCVVFWCSFWVGFWLSESLRGVLTPARNGRLQAEACASASGGSCASALHNLWSLVPPACRGNLKEGVFNRACSRKLCPRD
jgi:hypothetical protein